MWVHLGHVVHEGSLGCQEELEVWREGCAVHVLSTPSQRDHEEGSGWGLGEPQYLEAEQRRAWGPGGELWPRVNSWKEQYP